MSRIIITIEDKADGHVTITSVPPFSELAQKTMQREGQATAADGYALRCWNACRQASKEVGSKLIIKLPRIRG